MPSSQPVPSPCQPWTILCLCVAPPPACRPACVPFAILTCLLMDYDHPSLLSRLPKHSAASRTTRYALPYLRLPMPFWPTLPVQAAPCMPEPFSITSDIPYTGPDDACLVQLPTAIYLCRTPLLAFMTLFPSGSDDLPMTPGAIAGHHGTNTPVYRWTRVITGTARCRGIHRCFPMALRLTHRLYPSPSASAYLPFCAVPAPASPVRRDLLPSPCYLTIAVLLWRA